MFEHDVFVKYDFREVALGQDTHLMDVRWMRDFETEWIRTAQGEDADPYVVGYVTDISAIEIADNVLCREAAAGFGQQISMRRQPSARHAI